MIRFHTRKDNIEVCLFPAEAVKIISEIMCKFENHKIDTDIHSLRRLSENQLSVTSEQQDAYQLSAILKVSDSNMAILILTCCLFGCILFQNQFWVPFRFHFDK